MKIQMSKQEVEKVVLDYVRKNMSLSFSLCEIHSHRYGDDFCEVLIVEEVKSEELDS